MTKKEFDRFKEQISYVLDKLPDNMGTQEKMDLLRPIFGEVKIMTIDDTPEEFMARIAETIKNKNND